MSHAFTVAKCILSTFLLFVSSILISAQNPVPFLSQPLVPAAIAPARPGATFALTVNGTGFVPGAKVNWNGKPRTTFFSGPSQLIAFILSSDIAAPTTAWITVVNPGPGGGTSNTLFLPVHTPISGLAFQRRDYPVGVMPMFSTATDINGDGILDLAVPANISSEVLFLLGNGDGTFRKGDSYPVRWGAMKPILADFDRDGIPDMTVTVYSSGVAMLLGRGDGTFQSPVYYPAGDGPTLAIAADFNRDGNLDVATVIQTYRWVSVLLGNGDGSFQRYVQYPVGEGPSHLVSGDFNRDGKLDLAVSNCGSDNVSILLGLGGGTFRRHVDYDAGHCPSGVAAADFNGDGKLDLVVANLSENNNDPHVSILLGNGDGTFRPQVKYPTTMGAAKVDIADFNADGKLDLVVSHGTDGQNVDILLGNGDGTFEAPLSFVVDTAATDVSAYDFNGDGRMDIVTSNYAANSISVLIAQPTLGKE